MNSLNKKEIISLTNITSPFLMIDKIENLIKLKSSMGIKKIEKDAWFLRCHFKNNPMMPGTLIEESMLQTIVCTLYSSKRFKNKVCLITSCRTNFYNKVSKSSLLKIKAKILKITKLKVEATAIVYDAGNTKISSGIYSYFISKK